MSAVVHMNIVDDVLKTVYVKFDGRGFQEAIHDNSIPVSEYRQEFLYILIELPSPSYLVGQQLYIKLNTCLLILQ